MSKFTEAVERNTPDDFPNLVCGWPDAEWGIDWDGYKEYLIAAVDELREEDGPLTVQAFDEWKKAKWESVPDDLGFSHLECDLCGALPGTRHAVTALPNNPAENHDYVTMAVCDDCLMYIANGEEPDYD